MNRAKQQLTKFTCNKKYRLLRDYTDIIYGVVFKGTTLTFIGPNLGYAKFRLGWKDIAVEPKLAFKIFEDAAEPAEQKAVNNLSCVSPNISPDRASLGQPPQMRRAHLHSKVGGDTSAKQQEDK